MGDRATTHTGEARNPEAGENLYPVQRTQENHNGTAVCCRMSHTGAGLLCLNVLEQLAVHGKATPALDRTQSLSSRS